MEKVRNWFGTPWKALNTTIWTCFVLLVAGVSVSVVTILVFWVNTRT
jgi:hypothetical protein